MICNYCGYSNIQDAAFCTNCGKPLEQAGLSEYDEQPVADEPQKEFEPEDELEKDSEGEYIYTQSWLKRYTRMRGWLIFFMVVLLGGSTINLLSTLEESTKLNRFGYEEVTLVSVALSLMIVGIAVYTLIMFISRSRNAVFVAHIYLITNLVLAILCLVSGLGITMIGGIIGAIIWLLYLHNSVVVEECIPKSYRKASIVDWILGAVCIGLDIAYVVVLKSALNSISFFY